MTPDDVEAERSRLEKVLSDAMDVHESACRSLREASDALVRFNSEYGIVDA